MNESADSTILGMNFKGRITLRALVSPFRTFSLERFSKIIDNLINVAEDCGVIKCPH